MDELISLLVYHWRVGLSVLAAALVALLLCIGFSWFVGWPSILLVLVGGGGGVLWEGDAQRADKPPS